MKCFIVAAAELGAGGWIIFAKGFISMRPVAWARPRFHRGRGFELASVKTAKTQFRWLAQKEWPLHSPPEAPLKIVLDFQYKKAAKARGLQKQFPAKRPDIDNLIKFILDAGNQCLWRDDDQIVEITAVKNYGETEGIFLELSQWSPL